MRMVVIQKLRFDRKWEVKGLNVACVCIIYSLELHVGS